MQVTQRSRVLCHTQNLLGNVLKSLGDDTLLMSSCVDISWLPVMQVACLLLVCAELDMVKPHARL